MTMDEGSIHYEIWGELVDKEPGREPRPREKLIGLLRDIGNYMACNFVPITTRV